MNPTMSLRFFERRTFVHTAADGKLLPDGARREVKVRVLQQLWADDDQWKLKFEWRDVPLVVQDTDGVGND